MSATLKMGQSMNPRLMGPMKSTTPSFHRIRSIRFPRAPASTRESAKILNRSAALRFGQEVDQQGHGDHGHGDEEPPRVVPDAEPESGAPIECQIQRNEAPEEFRTSVVGEGGHGPRLVMTSKMRTIGRMVPSI